MTLGRAIQVTLSAGDQCRACIDDHYTASDRSCKQCPENTFKTLVLTFLPFVGLMVVTYIIMGASVWKLESLKGSKEPVAIALRQSKEFAIWVCLSAQILATASSSNSPGIPSWLNSIYVFVSFFNMDTSRVVHAECIKSPWLMRWLVIGCALALMLVQAGVFAGFHYQHHQKYAQEKVKKLERGSVRILGKSLAGVQGTLFVLLSAMYPLIAKNTLFLINCQQSADPRDPGIVLVHGPVYVNETFNALMNNSASSLSRTKSAPTLNDLRSNLALLISHSQLFLSMPRPSSTSRT